MGDSAYEQAAAQLRMAHSGHLCGPVRGLIGLAVDDGYAVQDINTDTWISEGRKVSGYKTGLTAKSVQAQMGVDQPDFGVLFEDTALESGAVIDFGRLQQPRAEAEIALVLGKDLKDADLSIEDLVEAVSCAVPALEIVGSRIRGWDIRISDTIADNASSGVYVLGRAQAPLSVFDPKTATMTMTRNGRQVSSGNGEACLGSPLLAAHWLARQILGRGRRMEAGHVLLTGALGPMADVVPGDVLNANISGLGSVEASFRSQTAPPREVAEGDMAI